MSFQRAIQGRAGRNSHACRARAVSTRRPQVYSSSDWTGAPPGGACRRSPSEPGKEPLFSGSRVRIRFPGFGMGIPLSQFFIGLDTGSGKTRFLLTAGSLCYKPIFASGASTVSPLFRILDSMRGTLIVDEGDFRFSDEKAELVKILNNGNGRGFPVLRSESVSGREFSPRAYTVFGPKLIATRGYFQDRALESRCLTEETGGRKLRDDIPINLTGGYKREAQELRNKLLMFRFRSFGKRQIDPAVADRSIEPRLAQIFVPLLSVIEDAGARQALRQVARDYHRELVADRGMDIEAQVLEIIQELQATSDGVGLSIKEIANRFIEQHGEDFERKVTPHWIGQIVRRKLGLKTERTKAGYVLAPTETAKLVRLYEKYGIATADEGGVNLVNSVNSGGDMEPSSSAQEPLII